MQRFILCCNVPNFTPMLLLSELCECLELLCNVDYACEIVSDFNMSNVVWIGLNIQPTKCFTFINFVINGLP